ncbi:AAA family ATPase [Paenibacillus sp. FSL R5-0486]|uniref:AAA family ATPase n=1 Tax=Paenibacillus sp. FSL R5-0486 TaxID=2921645 RepID=UPI0030DD90D4
MVKVVGNGGHIRANPINQFYLVEDDWNDWWEFKTMYSLRYVNHSGEIEYIGSLKIGQVNMSRSQKRPDLPEEFDQLNDEFFSVGQDVSYYESLNNLGDDIREGILKSLNDMALLSSAYEKAMSQRVTGQSLMRSVQRTSVLGQYRRLAKGDARLTPYEFKYVGPYYTNTERLELTFEVGPKSNPPTNIHILIGRNAVGKTFLMNNMIDSLIDKKNPSKVGYFSPISEEITSENLFANVVSVSFSAFDPAEPLPERRNKLEGTPYSYIGLKQFKKPPKSPDNLKYEFANSLNAIVRSSKTTRWLRAVEMLSSDPIFMESDVPSILQSENEDGSQTELDETDLMDQGTDEEKKLKSRAQKFFHRLSSGHKIVLLTLTRLVETVEERTIVLLDEPEAHLHPPLLSAFVRALSDLLTRRNAVAIIATHSPVILQEVPRSCVWKLRRQGKTQWSSRTEIETFGEGIGALTREIFELEVFYSGFYKMLTEAVEEHSDYVSILEHFNNELGIEARAIVRGLVASIEKEEE